VTMTNTAQRLQAEDATVHNRCAYKSCSEHVTDSNVAVLLVNNKKAGLKNVSAWSSRRNVVSR
jgi:hypothetical protein